VKFGNRFTIVSLSQRWVITRPHALTLEERSNLAGRSDAAWMVDKWCNDVNSWPDMLQLYEEITGDRLRPPTTEDRQYRVIPRLQRAFLHGELVALKLPVSGGIKTKAKQETGIHGRKPDELPSEPPPPPKSRKPSVISEKTFLDVQLLDEDDKPVVGRKYKLELPDGRVEQGTLGADGRIRKTNIDPGTGRLTILNDTTAPIAHEELPEEPDEEPEQPDEAPESEEEPEVIRLRIRVQDVGGDPLTSECILTVDGAEHELAPDDEGIIEVEIPASAKEGSLRVDGLEYDLGIGELDPADSPEGLQVRLRNLGYLTTQDEPSDLEVLAAIEEFQYDNDLPLTGEADGATVSQLIEVYGS
jgi:hypothetical protein